MPEYAVGAALVLGVPNRPSPQPVYFESVVVLTNPDVQASGQSIPTTDKNNPTLDSIDGFVRYLKHRQGQSEALLSRKQCQDFAAYIQKLHSPGVPRDFVFPGYEIVDRLYQYGDRAEVIAKRTDIRHRRLCRLRVFYWRSDLSEPERQQWRERAFNTLNAVTKIGDHPNLLKVWDIRRDPRRRQRLPDRWATSGRSPIRRGKRPRSNRSPGGM